MDPARTVAGLFPLFVYLTCLVTTFLSQALESLSVRETVLILGGRVFSCIFLKHSFTFPIRSFWNFPAFIESRREVG